MHDSMKERKLYRFKLASDSTLKLLHNLTQYRLNKLQKPEATTLGTNSKSRKKAINSQSHLTSIHFQFSRQNLINGEWFKDCIFF